MKKIPNKKSLLDAYRFSGFKTKAKIKGHHKVSKAVVLSLSRRQKKQYVDAAVQFTILGMTIELNRPEIYLAEIIKYILNLSFDEYFARDVMA